MCDKIAFRNVYEELLQYPNLKGQLSNYVYVQGITLIKSIPDFLEKEDIILKLLILYPDKSDLYYMLAELYKKKDPIKALTWYKICYQIDPNHKENIIDMITTFYKKGLDKQIIEIIEIINPRNSIYNELIEDSRFLEIYTNCKIINKNYKNCIHFLLKLIKENSKKPSLTEEEKVSKWSNYHSLGMLYCDVGEIEKSLQYTNKALELANKFNLTISKKLSTLNNSYFFSEYYYYNNDEIFKQYLKVNDYLPDNPCFDFEKRKNVIKNLYIKTQILPRKIKIGYLSSDFNYHTVANFIIPILKYYDTSKFDIVLYANQKEIISEVFISLNLQHHTILKMSDKDVATLINKHNVDILFDLNGHTKDNRLGVFTYHPAPIQITYLGYPNTTGLKSIDYRISDLIADPSTSKQKYSETLLKLPRCFLLFESILQKTPVIPRITQKNKIILGLINKENKNSSFALETWKIILKECPNTDILIKLYSYDENEERLEYYSKKFDVESERIIIVNKLTDYEYTNIFSKIDILLDTFPYSGTTTTCNALFNSIPLVSLYNENYHAHNVSSSILINCGLEELVVKTQEEYINIVKYLVNNPWKIDEYKNTIREKFLKLMEPGPFMKEYEGLLVDVYKKYYEL